MVAKSTRSSAARLFFVHRSVFGLIYIVEERFRDSKVGYIVRALTFKHLW